MLRMIMVKCRYLSPELLFWKNLQSVLSVILTKLVLIFHFRVTMFILSAFPRHALSSSSDFLFQDPENTKTSKSKINREEYNQMIKKWVEPEVSAKSNKSRMRNYIPFVACSEDYPKIFVVSPLVLPEHSVWGTLVKII